MSALPTFPSFGVYADGCTATRWKKWKSRLSNLLVAMDITSNDRKKALLLHYAGEEVYEIFTTLPLDTSEEEEVDVYEQAVSALDAYFMPKKNTEFEIYKFRQAKQDVGEQMDTYHTRLRKLAETCEFTNIDKEIKSQIVQSCQSSRLRRRVLRDDTLNLSGLLQMARSLEISEKQASTIEHSTGETANFVNKNKNFTPVVKKRTNRKCFYCSKQFPHENPCKPHKGGKETETHTFKKKQTSHKNANKNCSNCGGPFPHRNGPCPAKSSKSTNYRKKVYAVDNKNSSSSDEYLFSVNTKKNQPKVTLQLEGSPVSMIIDTGATVNIIDEQTYSLIVSKPKLDRTQTKLYPYGSKQPINILGTFEATITYKHNETKTVMYVVKGSYGSLLSYETAVTLNIIPTIRVVQPSSTESIINEFPRIFEGIGKVKGVQAQIHIDETVKPIIQQHRRIPFHMRKKVENELKRLESLDIIEKVNDEPTPWVSPLVVAPKPKKPEEIRICVDMRIPNEAVKRERHITPTIDDIVIDLNGATVFSKLDLTAGYHQVELTPESRKITTFTTHVGLYRYKRLIFGVSSAAEKFQSIINSSLDGLDGAKNISDDIIVFGRNEEEHNERLRNVFKRLKDENITLNRSKCEFNKDSIKFFGYVFSKDGLSADPQKIEALRTASPPTNQAEVRSLLGLANYVSRFIPDFATTTAALRVLTHKNVPWHWNKVEKQAFEELKSKLSTEAMTYFDPAKYTELVVDASPVGLGAILTQGHKIVSYASKSLSDTEKRYSQTEREALAIVWACEHYHLYLYGSTFTLITDHKPLETIFNNPKSRPPARIERWRLRLQPYDFVVQYRSGKGNPADYMSRHPTSCTNTFRHSKVAEEYLSFIVTHTVPKAITLEEITIETNKDTILQEVINRLISGNWKDIKQKTVQSYFRVRDELTIAPTDNGSVILCNLRLVIPSTLQNRVINIAHEGHQGIVKTKQLLREKVWFPGINEHVQKVCRECIPCLASTPNTKTEPLNMTVIPMNPWTHLAITPNTKTEPLNMTVIPMNPWTHLASTPNTKTEPLNMTVIPMNPWTHLAITPNTKTEPLNMTVIPMNPWTHLASTPNTKTEEPLNMTVIPMNPWTHLSADFYGPMPTGEYLLVVIDDHTRYPVVELIHSLSAKTVMPKLDKIFSQFGIPEVLKTDNGPPFQGKEFRDFSSYLGFVHRRITPLWPKANGEAERFMRTLGKTIKAATVDHLNWKQELFKFLRNYRATPHSSTNLPPAQVLFGRNIKTKLPEHKIKDPVHKDIVKTDMNSKHIMKEYADKRNNAASTTLKEGDFVLVKTPKKHKLSTPFDPHSYKIIKKHGTKITAERGRKRITRNSSHFKQIDTEEFNIPTKDESDNEDMTDLDPVSETSNSNNTGDSSDPVSETSNSNSTGDSSTNTQPLNRPVRVRHPPSYLKDFVRECVTE